MPTFTRTIAVYQAIGNLEVILCNKLEVVLTRYTTIKSLQKERHELSAFDDS